GIGSGSASWSCGGGYVSSDGSIRSDLIARIDSWSGFNSGFNRFVPHRYHCGSCFYVLEFIFFCCYFFFHCSSSLSSSSLFFFSFSTIASESFHQRSILDNLESETGTSFLLV